MNNGYRALAWLCAKSAVSLGLLVFALYLMDWETLLRSAVNFDPWVLLATVFVLLCEFPLLALRWKWIVDPHCRLPILWHLRAYFLAVFLGSFTPSQVGGDIYRVLAFRKHGQPVWLTTALVLKERLLGLLAYLLFFLVCWIFALDGADSLPSDMSFPLAGLFLLACLALLAAPFLMPRLLRLTWLGDKPRLRAILEMLAESFSFGQPKTFGALMFLSFLGGSVLWNFGLLLTAWGAGFHLSFWFLGMVAVLVELLRLFPISVQGLGIREASFAFFFAQAGLGAEAGFLVGAVAYACASLAMILCGAIGKLIPSADIALEG